MTAYKDLTINQGSTFEEVFVVKDSITKAVRDLSGYTARMQARLTVENPTPLFDIIPTIDGPNGKVTVIIPKATTAAYSWRSARYDLEIDNGIKAERILEGFISVSPEVTR